MYSIKKEKNILLLSGIGRSKSHNSVNLLIKRILILPFLTRAENSWESRQRKLSSQPAFEAPHLISGPMTECLRSMALALALLRSEVSSPSMAKMASPTPSLPSWLTEPPWTTLRTSMPEPSLIALTVIPANTRTHTRAHTCTHARTHTDRDGQVRGGLAGDALNRSQADSRTNTNTWRPHNQRNQDRH